MRRDRSARKQPGGRVTQCAGRGDLPETVSQRSARDPRTTSPVSCRDEEPGGRVDVQRVLVNRWVDGSGASGTSGQPGRDAAVERSEVYG